MTTLEEMPRRGEGCLGLLRRSGLWQAGRLQMSNNCQCMTETDVLHPAGDFDAREMRKLVEDAMGRWRVADGQPAVPPQVPNPPLPEQKSAGQVTRTPCLACGSHCRDDRVHSATDA